METKSTPFSSVSFFLVRTSAKSTSVYTNFRQEDRVFTFSCEFEKEAVPDDIAEPNEDGLVSSTTESTTTKITNSAQNGEENQTKTTTESSGQHDSVLINFIPIVLLLCSFLV